MLNLILIFFSLMASPQSSKEPMITDRLDVSNYQASQGCDSSTNVTLYSEGKPLVNTGQQDQDGILTCYANAASLMIKSINPDLPVPSFHDIASYNNIKDGGNDQYKDFEWGSTCKVIQKIQNEMGANPALCSDHIFEFTPLQDELIYPIYNMVNNKNNPKELEEAVINFSNFIKKNEAPSKEGECSENIKSAYVQSYITESASLFDKDNGCDQKIKKYLNENKISLAWKVVNESMRISDSSGSTLEKKIVHFFKKYNYETYSSSIGSTIPLNYDAITNQLSEDIKTVNKKLWENILNTHPDCNNSDRRNLLVDNTQFFINSLYNSCYPKWTHWVQNYNSKKSECTMLPYQFADLVKIGDQLTLLSGIDKSSSRGILGQMVDLYCPNKSVYKMDKYKCQEAEIHANNSKKMLEVIRSSLEKNRALTIYTCSSIFINGIKSLYPGCANHAVTITGHKCLDGRPKIFITNSMGILCDEDEKSKKIFECEKDSNGITTGRAWVDYEYLIHPGGVYLNYFEDIK
jgi:hypothetical protein